MPKPEISPSPTACTLDIVLRWSLTRLPWLLGLCKKRGATEEVNPALDADPVFIMGRWEQLAREATRWVVVGIILKRV